MLEHIHHKRPARHRPTQAPPAPTERPTAPASPEREPQMPESGTERWKRQVEAEARHRLKRYVRGLGTRRK